METGDSPSGDGDAKQIDASDAATINLDAIDLDAVERDLAGVEIALERLEAGNYWTCEITGQRLDDALLELDPTARRLPAP